MEDDGNDCSFESVLFKMKKELYVYISNSKSH
jgi:hypothetical protein